MNLIHGFEMKLIKEKKQLSQKRSKKAPALEIIKLINNFRV